MRKSRPLSLPATRTLPSRGHSGRAHTKEESPPSLLIAAWWGILALALFVLVPGVDGSLAQLGSRLLAYGLIAGVSWLLWRRQQRHALQAVADRTTTEQSLTEQRGLLHTVISAQERERKRLAVEWHDRLGTKLFEVLQGFRSCQTLIAQRAPESQERFAKLAAELDSMAALVRTFTNELHPPVLDEFGFVAAVREYLTGFDGQDPFRVTLQTEEVDPQLDQHTQAALFRITQESLHNIRTHARATQVTITCTGAPTGVSLVIRDNGVGFQLERVPAGRYGLLSMRERAAACGGTLQISSVPGQGTEVRVDCPAAGRATAPRPRRERAGEKR